MDYCLKWLALFGRRVPLGLKILLLSLAIADDIGAVLVIALVYTGNIQLPMLGGGFFGLVLVYFFAAVGVRSYAVYVMIGAGIWLAFFASDSSGNPHYLSSARKVPHHPSTTIFSWLP